MKPPNNSQDASKPGANLIEAEIQHNIPVKQHADQNPIHASKQFDEQGNKNEQELDKNEQELDKVLKDVNKSVKAENNKPPKKSLFNFHFFKAQKKQPATPAQQAPGPAKPAIAEPVKAPQTSKPMLVAVVAALAAVVLSIAAFYAFKQPAKKQPNASGSKTNQTASSSSVTSSKISATDINNAVNDLNSKIDSLNDTQDFNNNDLSDSALGLQ